MGELEMLGLRGMLLGILLLLCGCQSGGPVVKCLIPAGYVGWVQVRFGLPDAPPLPRTQDGSYLLRIPKNGLPRTSTPQEALPEYFEFYYVSGKPWWPLKRGVKPDDGGMVWGYGLPGKVFSFRGIPGTTKTLYTDREFFIGTYEQFDHNPGQPANMKNWEESRAEQTR